MTMWCSSSPTARPSPITTPAASASWIWCRARGSRPRSIFPGMGIEPLGNELSGETIARLFQGKRTPLKAALLDQRLIAGLGNIYVCEALFRTGLHPEAPAGSLATKTGKPTEKAHRLADIIRDVLDGGRRGRRLDPARSCAGRRLARLLPALLQGLRPGGRALRDARLHRHGDAPRAIRTLHLLLPGLPEALPRLKRKPLVRFSLARLSGLAYRCLIQR